MSHEIVSTSLEKIAQECLLRSQGGYTSAQIIWHGGEPLLRTRDFYSAALEVQKKYPNVKFNNSLQSNLTLLDDAWMDFFLKYDFKVGGSLDGPDWANGISRPTMGGDSSTQRVLENILAAKQKGLNIGVITVIGRHNYQRLPELYAFFKHNGIDFEANMLTSDGFAKDGSLSLTPKEFAYSVNQLFDLWFYDKEEPILTASSFMKNAVAMLTGESIECTFSGFCRGRYISIAANGDVYPCGRFNSKETPQYKLGNILRDDLRTMILSPPQELMASRDTSEIEKCADCEYVKVCKGGCPYNALLAYGDIKREDNFCEAYKKIFSHIRGRVEEEIRRL
jgi:uncharacterized protein